MKDMTLLLAAALAAGVSADCLPCAGAQTGTKLSQPDHQEPQEKVKTDAVTFHVMGMKKTVSGAT